MVEAGRPHSGDATDLSSRWEECQKICSQLFKMLHSPFLLNMLLSPRSLVYLPLIKANKNFSYDLCKFWVMYLLLIHLHKALVTHLLLPQRHTRGVRLDDL